MTAVAQPEPVSPSGSRSRRSFPPETRRELGRIICARVAQGELSKKACQAVGITTMQWWQWTEADPELRALWERARVQQAHTLAEETVSIADEVVGDMAQVQRNRLRADTRKWFTAKLAPRIYGERVEHEHTHRVGVVLLPPVQGASAGAGLVQGSASARAGLASGEPETAGTGPIRSVDVPSRAFVQSVTPEVLALPDVTPDTDPVSPVSETGDRAKDESAQVDEDNWVMRAYRKSLTDRATTGTTTDEWDGEDGG